MEGIEADIFLVIQSVCGATLGLEVDGPDGSTAGTELGKAIGALVEISGDAPASLLLECSEDMAKAAASALFVKEPEDLTPRDLQDAVSELVNIIAGNVRALVSTGSQLGIPQPATDIEENGQRSEPEHEIVLSCDGMPFRFSATALDHE
ncbi:MAG: chemotaxis protein CheX [Planctomycetota bacterium]|jgi:CheY-specific phosphatase CheX